MAFLKTKQNGVATYGINEYLIDSIEDLSILPTNITPGSKAYDPNSNKKYILTNEKTWIELKGNSISITEGSTDYQELSNKPQINGIELTGNKTLDELGIQAKGEYITWEFLDAKNYIDQTEINNILEQKNYATKDEIPTNISELTNDTNYTTVNEVKDLTDLTYYYNKTDIDGKDFAAKSDVADSISLLKTVDDAIQLGNVEKTLNINSKDDVIKVNSRKTIALLQPYPDESRLSLMLKNHDSISGKTLNGSSANLIMLSEWDIVDVGSNTLQTNLNAKNYKVTLNDDSTLLYTKTDLKENANKLLMASSSGEIVVKESLKASEIIFDDGESLQQKFDNGTLNKNVIE